MSGSEELRAAAELIERARERVLKQLAERRLESDVDLESLEAIADEMERAAERLRRMCDALEFEKVP